MTGQNDARADCATANAQRNPELNSDRPEIPGGRGGTLRPWQPGQSGNPEGMNKARREAYRLAKQAAPEAMAVLIERMADPAEDSRVRTVAANAVLDRALGKPKETPPEDDDKQDVDLLHLSNAEVAELHAALETVRRLTGHGLAPIADAKIYIPDNGRGLHKGAVLYADPDRITTVRHIIVDPKDPEAGE